MKRFFTQKKIKFRLLPFVVLLISTISNGQLVQKWVSSFTFAGGSLAPVKGAILVTSDGNIVSAGRTEIKKFSTAGDQIWSASITFPALTHSFVHAIAMATDPAGNIYLTGVRGAHTNISFGDIDILIAKYSPDGREIWTKIYNGPIGLDDESVGIGIDQSSNVYVAGNVFTDQGKSRIHTLKLNGDGVLQWAVTYNENSFSQANAIAVDFFTGDVYVAGTSSVPNDGKKVHFTDFTTIKYNTNGEQQWVSLFDGDPGITDEARAITVDADGNALVTGFSMDDNSANSLVFTTIKYDRITGHEIWRREFGVSQSEGDDFIDDIANAITTDGDGNVIVTGSIHIREQWATIKYRKSDGKTLWTQIFDNAQFVPADDLDFGFDEAFAVAVDGANNVFVTGYTKTNSTLRDFLTIEYRAADGNEIDRAQLDLHGEDEAVDIAVDPSGNSYITGDGGGLGGAFTTVKYGLCSIVCPQAITVNNDPGKCGAIVNFSATTTGNCGPLVFFEGGVPVSSGSFFAVGQHDILVKSESTGETCNFTITVVDNEKPVITQCAVPLTVSCAANVPSPDISLIKATDNCEVVTITHAGDVISNQTCTNRFTLTRTYKATDSHGNTATCTQVITVNDNVPPQIVNFSLSQESLSPPNHKMQDITLNYQLIDNCVSNPPVKITISSNEPVNGTGDGDTDPDWVVVDDHHIQLRAERAATGNGRIYTVTVTADDGCNPAVSVTKQVLVVHNITAPQSGNPFSIGSTVNLAGTFWDKPANKHTAKWLLDGASTTNGTVTEPSGNQNGKVTGSYKFNTAGVYKLQMNVTDQTGITSYANTNGDLEAIVVIYDPNGGYTFGGGYFDSPKGAHVSNSSASGKASYGFAVNYKNTAKPQGETQFDFKVGSFEFNAVNFDYLVINGAMAQFRGTGKITGGQSGIGFVMTVTDGALNGTGVDKIRMKIYNKNTGAVIYDNQPGASDADLPITPVAANSTIVVQGSSANTMTSRTSDQSLPQEKAVDILEVKALPNPTNNYFTITIKSNDTKERIVMQVFDEVGRSIEHHDDVIPGSAMRIGATYSPGAYYVRITQGKEQRELKLIKLAD